MERIIKLTGQHSRHGIAHKDVIVYKMDYYGFYNMFTIDIDKE